MSNSLVAYPAPGSRVALLGVISCGVGIAVILCLWRSWRTASVFNAHVPEFIGSALAASALYLAAVYLALNRRMPRVSLYFILAATVLFRALLLPVQPPLSDDVYRYQWEGRIQRAGLNPYGAVPDNPALKRFQDPLHPITTGHDTPTLYPPLAEAIFSWVSTVPGYKRLFTLFDLATAAILIFILQTVRQPLAHVLIYAWNPTVLVAFTLCGHFDAVAIFLLATAILYIIKQQSWFSNLFLAAGFLVKFFPVLLLPWVIKRRRWQHLALFLAIVAAAYFRFLNLGWGLFRGASNFARGWEANDSLFRVLRWALPSRLTAEAVAAILLLVLVVWSLQQKLKPLNAGLLLITALLLVSPDAFPWYFTWVVPFLCFVPNPPLLLLSITVVLGYAPVTAYAAGQPYRNNHLLLLLEYLPPLAWLAARQATRKFAFHRKPTTQGKPADAPAM